MPGFMPLSCSHGMVADGADQRIWADRIQKEERVHTKINPKAFSVRRAVTAQDVPAKFKPGHLDPLMQQQQMSFAGFDPEAIGWDPKGKLAREVFRVLAEQERGPRERHLFPETTQEEMGWLLTQATDKSMRKSVAGALPKCGFGWVDKSGLHKPKSKDKDEKNAKDVSQVGQRPQKRSAAPVRPPYAITSKEARQAAAVALGKTSARSHLGSALSAAGPGSQLKTGSSVNGAALSVLSAAAPSTVSKAASVPSLGSASSVAPIQETPEYLSCEQDLFTAMDRVKQFQNRQPSCRWYHPLSHSEEAKFADHYTKVWKGHLFHRRGTGVLG